MAAAETPTLTVQSRDERGTSASGRLRREGFVPGVCYGPDTDSVSITLDPVALKDMLDEHQGRNTVFSLDIEGGETHEHVLIRDHQFDPVKRELTHIDLFIIKPGREITVDVPIEPYGEAEGVHMGGQLQIVRPAVPVLCRADSIPDSIRIDVTDLGPEESYSVQDLEYPEGTEPATDADFAVVRIMMPRTGVVGLEPTGPEADEEAEEEEAVETEGEEPEVAQEEGEEQVEEE